VGAPKPAVSPARRQLLTAVVALLAATGLLAGGWTLRGVTWTSTGPEAPTVVLPDAEDVAGEGGLDPRQRAEALAPFDPDRTVCAPTGCELWRRPAQRWWLSWAQVVGDPVVVEDEHLIGLDLQTGAVRWQQPLADELRNDHGGFDLSMGRVMLAGDERLVAFVNPHGVQVVTTEGAGPLGGSPPAGGDRDLGGGHRQLGRRGRPAGAAASSIRVRGRGRGRAVAAFPLRVTAFDGADGAVRWTQQVDRHLAIASAAGAEQDLLLVRSDGLDARARTDRRVSPGSSFPWGRTRSRDTLVGPSPWPISVPGEATERTSLHAVVDGAVLAEVDGERAASCSRWMAELLVSVRRSGPGGEGSAREVVAFDPDGSVAWSQPFEPGDERCCPSLLDLGDGRARVADGGAAAALLVDVATGDVLSGGDPIRTVGGAASEQWQLGRSLLLEHVGDQAPRYYHDGTGAVLEVSGPGWAAMAADAGDILVLQSANELIAVRFP
jgi:outer membrane protein assembly factor BamB